LAIISTFPRVVRLSVVHLRAVSCDISAPKDLLVAEISPSMTLFISGPRLTEPYCAARAQNEAALRDESQRTIAHPADDHLVS
jgi:hypothetical protein